ncbi:MAG: thrombospondin type 3 repeat-containing protein [Proteobacteria bacterium]|nr:thrombospondin type 3 repeat-containing protein [Pseudomonadota bacterium]
MINRFSYIFATLLVLMFSAGNVQAVPNVNVYGSGTYSDSNAIVNIYATTLDCNLMSFGVTLNFDPADVSSSGVSRNNAVWYLGDGVTNSVYMSPAVDVSGVKMIGGRLDIANPTDGYGGPDILLGQMIFTRVSANVPAFTLTYAEGGTYVNYRTAAHEDLDTMPGGVVFGAVNLVPDADGDGVPDSSDVCPGFDDNADADGDLVPDGCDAFPSDPAEDTDTDGDGIGNNGDPCQLTMPIRKQGGSDYSQGLQAVYDLQPATFTVKIQSNYLSGPLRLDKAIDITIKGGYDCAYSPVNSGAPTVIDSLIIDYQSGAVTIDNVSIE